MAAFQVMNQDFMKLDRFDGTNFTRWQDKMMFLLTALKVQYVLDPNLPPLPEITDNDSDETKAARKKREEDELVCRGHILNALSDRLYDLFTSSKCPKEIWKALENKYDNEKQGADKFLTLKYFKFTMNDSESVLDQVYQLQILVSKLKDLKVEAYRLLDLESNVIVESRDVEFIEDKFNSDSDFSAPTISLEIDSNVGSSLENESVVPNNTTEPRRNAYGVIICLYVDDLLIFGTNLEGIFETKEYLNSRFKMKDLNEVDTVLGIKQCSTEVAFSHGLSCRIAAEILVAPATAPPRFFALLAAARARLLHRSSLSHILACCSAFAVAPAARRSGRCSSCSCCPSLRPHLLSLCYSVAPSNLLVRLPVTVTLFPPILGQVLLHSEQLGL
ncbi:hypothetical protein RJ639_022884 [Escallonia herrerae]|uniref:Reverse transcriptase Ty1/copia-type domain-containing protein n=1 Tax=Escallonia herrerae TaxID=1293975 RepID=A0AA89ACN4_9ASTE|nr:hypothetical protein RJ639_022884 [Escallonia herrerae]